MRVAVDANFRREIIEGLQRRMPHLDVVWVQQVGLEQAPDEAVLEWAAKEARILLTHDHRTMPDAVYRRIQEGLYTPAVIVVYQLTSVRRAIEDLELVLGASLPGELEARVIRLPAP
ncbi:MAG: DUF5615 family PIN-like protein [Fimbriimonadales bacterium]|nr:DUF5615 family PIN-like protein [Fimbriimonadales bacterium]